MVTTQKCLMGSAFFRVSTVGKRLRVENAPQGQVQATPCSLFGLRWQADAGGCFSLMIVSGLACVGVTKMRSKC